MAVSGTGSYAKDGSSLTSLLVDIDRYADVYLNAYMPNSEDDVIRNWIRDHFEKEVVDKIAESFPSENELRILGIGSADGVPDVIMLEKLLPRFKKILNTVVEPGAGIDQFRRTVEGRDEMKAVTFEWHKSTFDKYRLAATGSSKFAFISAIHSLYYMDSFVETVEFLLGSLADGGVLLIVIASDDNKFEAFGATQPWLTNNLTFINLITTSTVREVVDHTGHRVDSTHILSKTNVTSVFDNGSEEGSKLLDFVTGTSHFRETVRPEWLDKTLTTLKTFCAVSDAGLYHLSNDCDVLLIYK